MRVYDKVIKNMTPEMLAEITTKLVTVNNEQLFYMTSSGQLFPPDKYSEAVKYEYDWLTSELPETESGKEETKD